MVILKFDFESLKDKIMYTVVSPIQKGTKNVREEGNRCNELWIWFLVRESRDSL